MMVAMPNRRIVAFYPGFYIKTLIYLLAFYINYYILVDKTLGSTSKRRIVRFVFWNLVILAVGVALCYLSSRVWFPSPWRGNRAATVGPSLRHILKSASFIMRDGAMLILTIGLAVAMRLSVKWKDMEQQRQEMLAAQRSTELDNLKSQLNPHFLFNTLNAGLQLAMMEDAERTYTFIENMSSFFRYRLRKNGEESTLGEEVAVIDSYMHIMNVRYSNEIHLEKEIDPRLLDMLFPGMVLQPVIENALRHGLGEVEWEKRVWFSVAQDHGEATISIRDNGVGISGEALEALKEGEPLLTKNQEDMGNGVGLVNVRERLRLFFDRADVMDIESGGEGQGT